MHIVRSDVVHTHLPMLDRIVYSADCTHYTLANPWIGSKMLTILREYKGLRTGAEPATRQAEDKEEQPWGKANVQSDYHGLVDVNIFGDSLSARNFRTDRMADDRSLLPSRPTCIRSICAQEYGIKASFC